MMVLKPIDKQKLAIRIAWMAGIFSSVVGIILLLNYWQLKQSDPLENKLMENLVTQLAADRQNETLKEEIRNLDLMARKAYFTKQWQIRTGAYLLVGGMVILVVALRIFYSLRSKIEEPETGDIPLRTELLVTGRWVLAGIAVFFGLALFAAILSDDHLASSYAPLSQSTNAPAVEETNIIPAGNEIPDAETKVKTVDEEAAADGNSGGNEPGDLTEIPTETSAEPEEIKIPAAPVETNKAADLAGNFPSFRGPLGHGIASQKNIPVDWNGSENRNIRWKVKVPYPGYNSPVIWGDDLYLTGADETKQIIFCYDRNTGSLKWQHEVSGIQRPAGQIRKPTDDTGYAAPTVSTDGNFVAAIFATGDVACIDRKGNRIWARNLGIPDNHYGHSSSLITWNGLLLVQFDGNKGGKVLALDIRTGEEKWSTARKSKISWASPILIEVDGKHELILASSPHVAAYDPLTGEEKWAVECLTGEVGPSPAFSGGVVFAANEYAKLLAIRPGNPPEVLWETNEYLPEVSSPVAAEGLLFIATSYGVIACYDAGNGEILWEYECDQGVYASPLIADGKVFFLDMDGIMHIFKLDRTMSLIGEPELGEGAVSTPAVADGRFYIRGFEYLYCIGNN